MSEKSLHPLGDTTGPARIATYTQIALISVSKDIGKSCDSSIYNPPF
jgi:hypothetical protein